MQLMLKQDQETVRRLLEAALNKLDEESRGGEERSNSILFSESDAGTPLILVVIGELNSSTQSVPAPTLLNVDQTGPPATARSSVSGHNQTQVVHPGLERFPFAVTDSRPAAPKACFMEPGRACVSSGACEMRGF